MNIMVFLQILGVDSLVNVRVKREDDSRSSELVFGAVRQQHGVVWTAGHFSGRLNISNGQHITPLSDHACSTQSSPVSGGNALQVTPVTS